MVDQLKRQPSALAYAVSDHASGTSAAEAARRWGLTEAQVVRGLARRRQPAVRRNRRK